ncbi:MAG: ligase-associated DNA damage response exonuclease [Rhodomicrobium sp.]|nr:ligase-associated DNA damage response exonuclease [Rhodomicrobium sp.]
MIHPRGWMEVRPEGLYCKAGGFFVDPVRAVPQAVITHGHSDHARRGHAKTIATPDTLAIMACRYGGNFTQQRVDLPYRQAIHLGETRVTLYPAGHILGSAQVLIEYGGARLVVSGDYKRTPDPTACEFEPVPCDVFVTEATFGLPVFRHPEPQHEIGKLLASLAIFPGSCHTVGCYSLGKTQRLIAELRRAGYDKTIYLHSALVRLTQLYEERGVQLGPYEPITADNCKSLAGEIVLCPPAALADRWPAPLPDIIPAAASGWMQIRARAKQQGVELPLIISDHCDWPELIETIHETGAGEVWVTHGREEALVHYCRKAGLAAHALSLLGYEEEGEIL